MSPDDRRRDALAAGAERAGGERRRRRRRTTPLLETAEATDDGLSAGPDVRKDEEPGSVDGEAAAARTSADPTVAAARSGALDADSAAADGAAAAAADGVAPDSVAPDGGAPDSTAPDGGAPDSTALDVVAPSESGGADVAAPAARRRPPAPRRRTGAATGPASTRRARASSPPAQRPERQPRRLRSVPAGRAEDVAGQATEAGERIVADLGDDATPSEVAERVAAALALLRRRLTGDFTVDEFGFDAELTDSLVLPLLRPLYRRWFRIEVRGVENIPATGGALVVANHSGTIALDALMTQVAVHDEHPQHRHLRILGADLIFGLPFVGSLARKSGSTLAANPDAERLLGGGEVVGVWPEGFKGIGKPFSERYKLQRFGRGGFVSAALRTRTPIVPCSIVGAEEIYPILGNLPALARLLGTPYAPITPTFPLLGPLGLVPLPSKWLIEFGEPVPTTDLADAEAGDPAEDPMLVFDLTDRVRETIQHTLYSLLVQRRSVFF